MSRSFVLSTPDSCKVATPRDLAHAMICAIGSDEHDTWLEPCVGDGIFLELLKEEGVAKRKIRAVDLDVKSKPNDKLAKSIRGTEFLGWARKTKERFSKIVSNPPYVSLSAVDDVIANSAMDTLNLEGAAVPKSANLWYAFTCALIGLLEKGGNIAMVLPASWDFANYSSDLRQELPRRFQKFGVFRAAQPLFEQVQDGSVVIVGIGYQQTHKMSIRKEYSRRSTFVKSVTDFSSYKSKTRQLIPSKRSRHKRLEDYLNIRIGGVTGHADYFLLSETDRRHHNLPLSSVRPILSKSSHLMSATITDQVWQHLRDNLDRIWLFRPSKRSLKSDAVREYMELAATDGGCDKSKYKIKNRSPWFETPLEKNVDGFMSGMSRIGPWICFNDMKTLNATNTLYTVSFRNKCSRNEKFGLALFLLTSKIQRRFRLASRRYAQGLGKLEPCDLNCIEIGNIPDCVRPISTYRKCIKLLLPGENADVSRIADAAFWG